ncbi:pancreatic triacylglycerol lipase-like [Uloborus diversus]|uniref:pancreatic triacylglycerol lipase-like n=1 Tax=Uloborus diversus TaxID=327109 RepID=UPI00240A7F87|nr:pancreatic triacylglycerol lipase-like [Uloborus diversus]
MNYFAALSLLLVILERGETAEPENSDVISFITREKCFSELGCFSAKAPFFDIVERPLSLLPDDRESINTKFLLFTLENPYVPHIFNNMDSSLNNLPETAFNPKSKTKFVVPGFISSVAPKWKQALVNALLKSENSNVFLIDWSGGDGPLYEQAVANTRIVGAEIALFIKHLQSRTGMSPESVHIIGHSLGSHIAGYAGKNLTQSGLNLGRISAMDPAGPYFTGVDPVVRLDRKDALLVDAIHTNAAQTRFQGFGITESIAHFDFYPNGGHLQIGCKDMGHAIVSMLTHPHFDLDGLSDIMCNHQRSIALFISSILSVDCELMGVVCDSWEDFTAVKCGDCSVGSSRTCVAMGMHADAYASYVLKDRSINLYLNTTASAPFCLH